MFRPDLTWRDVQHITAITARPGPLMHNTGWKTNAAGYKVNTRFGFGLMDAHAMVKAAQTWQKIPHAYHCNFTYDMK